MKQEMAVPLILIAVASIIAYSECGDSGYTENNCPLWMEFRDGECKCRDFSDFNDSIFCDPELQTTYVAAGTCVTYDKASEEISIGDCPYVPAGDESYDNRFYTALPENESELNEIMCGRFNREGLLCGSCKRGYGVSASSYGYPCAKCDAPQLGGLWYVLLELVPITVLYAVVLLFRIRATEAPLVGLIFFSQVVYNTLRGAIPLYISFYTSNAFTFGLLQLALFLSGIWNLSFIRFFIPPYCISEDITNIYAYSLEYVPAFYPLFLVLITYVLIELHSHDIRFVVWIWKPFHRFFVRFRKTWNIKSSIINAFSTFLLFSYTKMMFVSFRLLDRVPIYNENGTISQDTMILDPTAESFGRTHWPIALVAVIIIFIFAVLPILLLLLYPTRLLQKLLQHVSPRIVQTLRVFVDTYQGCIKDGTNGTRDYRAVSAVYLILRVFLTIAYIEFTILDNDGVLLLLCGILFMLLSLLVAIFKPYKEEYMNYCELVMLFLIGIAAVLTYHWLATSTPHNALASILVIIMLLPHIALASYMGFVTFRLKMLGKWVEGQVKDKCAVDAGIMRHILGRFYLTEPVNEDLPDRFVHPDNYTTEYTEHRETTESTL